MEARAKYIMKSFEMIGYMAEMYGVGSEEFKLALDYHRDLTDSLNMVEMRYMDKVEKLIKERVEKEKKTQPILN